MCSWEEVVTGSFCKPVGTAPNATEECQITCKITCPEWISSIAFATVTHYGFLKLEALSSTGFGEVTGDDEKDLPQSSVELV